MAYCSTQYLLHKLKYIWTLKKFHTAIIIEYICAQILICSKMCCKVIVFKVEFKVHQCSVLNFAKIIVGLSETVKIITNPSIGLYLCLPLIIHNHSITFYINEYSNFILIFLNYSVSIHYFSIKNKNLAQLRNLKSNV